jgi:transcriptional regulator with XRE-family HTH domain
MSMNRSKIDDPKIERAYYRAMLRSAFLSVFWAVISERKKSGLTLISLAKAIGSSKHEVSRWFKGDPNWTINTIASIAHALKLTLQVQAIDEQGNVYGVSGLQPAQANTAIATSGVEVKPVNVTRVPEGSFVVKSDIDSSNKAA